MVFRRRRPGGAFRRRRVVRKRPMTSGSKALTEVRKLKRLYKPELKLSTVQLQAFVMAPTGDFVSDILHQIVPGDGDTDRQGSRIRLISYSLNYIIIQSASATRTQVRVVLLMDNKCNGVVPTAAEVFQDATSVDIITSNFNHLFVPRFKILYDKVHALSSSGTNNLYKSVKGGFPVNTIITYDADADAITSLNSKNYYLFFASNEITNDPSISMMFRVRYTDV